MASLIGKKARVTIHEAIETMLNLPTKHMEEHTHTHTRIVQQQQEWHRKHFSVAEVALVFTRFFVRFALNH